MQTKKEYGGFLPLELNPGQEYFEDYQTNLVRFNSVKAALAYLLVRLDVMKIYLPVYYCPSTTGAIKSLGKKVLFYHIDQGLMPENIPDEPDAAVILVNYFGLLDEKITKLADTYRLANVIIDNAHSFYCRPLIKEHIFNIYSAKKFFGIPDGSYLIGKEICPEEQALSYSGDYSGYLLISYEKGTDMVYEEKKRGDAVIAAHYAPMSVLALGLLKNADYERVRRRRIHNFSLFHKELEPINELKIPRISPAYHYPLLISKAGKHLKKQLIQNQIFVPTLWKSGELTESGNAFERNMSDNAVFLPIDQRYDDHDIGYIIETIRTCR